jgi:hypothetical protein
MGLRSGVFSASWEDGMSSPPWRLLAQYKLAACVQISSKLRREVVAWVDECYTFRMFMKPLSVYRNNARAQIQT